MIRDTCSALQTLGVRQQTLAPVASPKLRFVRNSAVRSERTLLSKPSCVVLALQDWTLEQDLLSLSCILQLLSPALRTRLLRCWCHPVVALRERNKLCGR